MYIYIYTHIESSIGRKFVIGFPRNNRGGVGPNGLFLSLANSETKAVDFTITATEFSFQGTLRLFQSGTRVSIPTSFEVLTVKERNKGILVEATGNIYVHGLSYSPDTSDSYLALPCFTRSINEYEYFAISYDVLENFSRLQYPSTILMVACDNDTVVTIGPTTIMLNRMETYEILSSTSDLTGIRITSSKPLSVISGVDCTSLNTSFGLCDHLVEQVPPTVTWGSQFFVGSLSGRNSNQLIRVLSARAATVTVTCNTAVSVDQFQLTSAGSHQTFEIPVSSLCSIESTGPVLVAQYASDEDDTGDPLMMIIPPTEQYVNKYTFQTYSEFNSYFTVYVAAEFYQISQLLINNVTISGWQSVTCSNGNVCGYIARISVDPGVYTIHHQNSSSVLGVSVYGFTLQASYGMPVALGLSPIQCNNMELTCSPICMEGFAESGRICVRMLNNARLYMCY